MSTPTVVLDASHLKAGDVAGLGLLNLPYATLGVQRSGERFEVVLYDQKTDASVHVPLAGPRVWLRAECDFLTERARFSYSVDGVRFQPIGDAVQMVFQLRTFQGVRYALFNYAPGDAEGGYADFDSVDIAQPHPHGLMRPIPYGKAVTLTGFHAAAGLSVAGGKLVAGAPVRFRVVDMGLGRVALRVGRGFVTVGEDAGVSLASISLKSGKPGRAQRFQWIETPTGELVLMSLVTDRFLVVDPKTGTVRADCPGPIPDGSDGARFVWAR
jgi:hypothetical protein